MHPLFLIGLVGNVIIAIVRRKSYVPIKEKTMEATVLGQVYQSGQDIIRQGDLGDCMYVIQAGQVQVLQDRDGQEVQLAVLDEGDFFGEMALFEHQVRSATVRAAGQVRILTIDKKTFLSRIHEDPSLAFRIVQQMSHRIRQLNAELTRLKSQ